MKVKIKNFDPSDTKVPESVLLKIKKFTNSHSKFTSALELAKECKIPLPFLTMHHVCMNCGDVKEMASYAIAQNAMGYTVKYTCKCGHVTILPQ